MTDAQEQVLVELAKRGPLTWFRLDALLSAAGFQIGPALFGEVDLLERDGFLMVVELPLGPKTYRTTSKGEMLAKYLTEVTTGPHDAWLSGEASAADSGNWDWLHVEGGLRDTADPSRGPRRAV